MTDFSNMDFQDIISTVEVMRMQEETGYRCKDYLHQQEPQLASVHVAQSATIIPSAPVDADCRFKMAQWCYQVVEFCKFNAETVAISMNYLDRYLSTPVGRHCLTDRKTFQLAAMVCLYTAVKIHEPEAMEPKVVAGLSRGAYTEQQVTDMEVSILTAIQWRMNPPTALSFAHSFLALLSAKNILTDSEKDAVFELAKFQTEAAVNEYELTTVCPSTIALAAVLNAIDTVSMKDAAEIQNELAQMVPSLQMSSVLSIQHKLFEIIGNSSSPMVRTSLARKSGVTKTTVAAHGSVHGSPRTVTASQ